MAGKNGKSKLTEEQRLAVLEWLAEGKTLHEVNSLAASFEPPFKMTSQQCYAYRKDYDIDLQKIMQEKDTLALNTGLALRANRVQALIALALLLEEDLRVKKLVWTRDVKSIAVGAGKDTEHVRIDFEVFNKAEIQELRGIYDDIAKETGGRITKVDVSSLGKAIKGYVVVDPDKWPDPSGANGTPK
jgi:hypothetical protein